MQSLYDKLMDAFEDKEVVNVSLDSCDIHLEFFGIIDDYFENNDKVVISVQNASVVINKRIAGWKAVGENQFVCDDCGISITIGGE